MLTCQTLVTTDKSYIPFVTRVNFFLQDSGQGRRALWEPQREFNRNLCKGLHTYCRNASSNHLCNICSSLPVSWAMQRTEPSGTVFRGCGFKPQSYRIFHTSIYRRNSKLIVLNDIGHGAYIHRPATSVWINAETAFPKVIVTLISPRPPVWEAKTTKITRPHLRPAFAHWPGRPPQLLPTASDDK